MTYREFVMSRATAVKEHAKLLFGAVGLAGEAGEVLETAKKNYFHGKGVDRTQLLHELGDVRFYLEYLAATSGFSMEEIEAANREKLTVRHPAGYNQNHYIQGT